MKSENICRLCASNTNNFVGIFADDAKQQLSSVGEMMLDCLFTELAPNSGYPEIVCQYCSLQLNIFCEFKKKVLENHINFTKKLGIICEVDESASCTEEQYLNIETSKSHEEVNREIRTASSVSIIAEEKIKSSIDINLMNIKEEIAEDIYDDDNAIDNEYLIDDQLYYEEMYLDEAFEINDEDDEKLSKKSLETKENAANIDEMPDMYENDLNNEKLGSRLQIDAVQVAQTSLLKRSKLRKTTAANEKLRYQQPFDERQCPFCPAIFYNKTPYNKHIRSHDIKVICEICDKPTYNLEEHKKQHENEFHCSICGKKFGSMFSCINHERRHSNDRPLRCTHCDKRFKLSSDLYNHMLCCNDIRRHICSICGKAFRMRSHLTNHLETHASTNIFQCSFCDMTLKTSKTLRSHVLQVHSTDHQYKCLYCTKGFVNKYKWRRHMNTVHSAIHNEKDIEEIEQENS